MKQARQKNWVIHQLNLFGEISRNKALDNYISRLGALIGTLKKEGWVFTAYYQQTENGKDYVYRVVKPPTLPPPFKPKKVVEKETNLKLL